MWLLHSIYHSSVRQEKCTWPLISVIASWKGNKWHWNSWLNDQIVWLVLEVFVHYTFNSKLLEWFIIWIVFPGTLLLALVPLLTHNNSCKWTSSNANKFHWICMWLLQYSTIILYCIGYVNHKSFSDVFPSKKQVTPKIFAWLDTSVTYKHWNVYRPKCVSKIISLERDLVHFHRMKKRWNIVTMAGLHLFWPSMLCQKGEF